MYEVDLRKNEEVMKAAKKDNKNVLRDENGNFVRKFTSKEKKALDAETALTVDEKRGAIRMTMNNIMQLSTSTSLPLANDINMEYIKIKYPYISSKIATIKKTITLES